MNITQIFYQILNSSILINEFFFRNVCRNTIEIKNDIIVYDTVTCNKNGNKKNQKRKSYIYIYTINNTVYNIPLYTYNNKKNLKLLDTRDSLYEKLIYIYNNIYNWEYGKNLLGCSLNVYDNILLKNNIYTLTFLKHLNLSGNKLSYISEDICHLQNLTSLILSHNCLRELPSTIGNLVKLERLIVSHNMLQTIPDSTRFLVNLTILDIGNNELEQLPNVLHYLIKLEGLIISYNKLNCLPTMFGFIQNLQSLSIGNNNLYNLPSSFCKLLKLKYLYVSKNNIKKLPKGFGNLINLNILDLSFNKLHFILLKRENYEINKLINLQNLNLSYNNIIYLNNHRDKWNNLCRLETLDISNNGLFHIFDLNIFKSLKKLIINNNDLTKLINMDKYNNIDLISDDLSIILEYTKIHWENLFNKIINYTNNKKTYKPIPNWDRGDIIKVSIKNHIIEYSYYNDDYKGFLNIISIDDEILPKKIQSIYNFQIGIEKKYTRIILNIYKELYNKSPPPYKNECSG